MEPVPNRRAALCFLAVLALLATPLHSALAQTEPDSADDGSEIAEAAESQQIERLLLLAPGQPLRIDLALSIEGRPLRAFWQSRIDELFADADHDRSGRLTIDQAMHLAEAAAGEFGQKPPRDRMRTALEALARGAPSGGSPPPGDGRIDRPTINQYSPASPLPFWSIPASLPAVPPRRPCSA